MATRRTAVFWSYAHEDDTNSHGAILRLRDDVAAAYSLLSGTSIEIFADRTSIGWGDEWKRVIDSALSEASFLIPIMTPRYFTRPECRRELLDFYAQAKSSDLTELVLPLLYVPIANFSEDNSEEAVRIAATLQYVPWTTLSLLDNTDVTYRTAVHGLGLRLHELLESVAATQLERERVAVEAPDTSDEDLDGLLANADRMWPDWLEAVLSDEIRGAQVDSIRHTFDARRTRLRGSRAAASVINSTYHQEAAAELPLAKQYLAYIARPENLQYLIDNVPKYNTLPYSGIKDKYSDIIKKFYATYPVHGTVLQSAVKYVTPQWMEIGKEMTAMILGDETSADVLKNTDKNRADQAAAAKNPDWNS